MSLNNAFDISTSGVAAERLHMEIIASNLANMNTTRTSAGGSYSRKMMVYYEKPMTFAESLSNAQKKIQTKGGGVEYSVVDDNAAKYQKVYNPGHPDADESGFVTLPNVSLANEMTDLVYASKLYEANIAVFNATKKMAQDTITIQ